ALRPLPGNEFARAHALWALARMDGLDGDTLTAALKDAPRAVRAHLAQILPTVPKLNNSVLAADSDPNAMRFNLPNLIATGPAGVGALLKAWNAAAKDDTELIYAARMSLRDLLLAPGSY